MVDGEFLSQGRGVPTGNGWAWIAGAWAFTGRQRGTFIGVFVVYCIVSIAVGAIPVLGSLAVALLSPVLTGGIMLGCDALRRGERLEITHVFAGFKNRVGRLIGVGAVTLAALAAIFVLVALIFGGEIAAVLAGAEEPSSADAAAMLVSLLLAVLVICALSVPIYMAIFFAAPLIVLSERDVATALKTSFAACLKNVMPFLVWGLAFLVLALLATIPLGLGWLLLGPVMMASVYLSYRDVFFAA